MATESRFYAESYCTYVQQLGLTVNDAVQKAIAAITDATDWENPTTGLDWNNTGVAALIQAQTCDDDTFKVALIEMAREAFAQGAAAFPLCRVHQVMLDILMGRFSQARQQAFQYLIRCQRLLEMTEIEMPLGLVYVPLVNGDRPIDGYGFLDRLLLSGNGVQQTYRYVTQVFVDSEQVFYNRSGLRTLAIATHIDGTVPLHQLKHGIAGLSQGLTEGLISLHQAHQLAPTDLSVLQSLFLAYRDLEQMPEAHYYWEQAHTLQNANPTPTGVWTQAPPDADITYVLFDQAVVLTLQPSFKSIVTSVLIAEGDWFESEMEFWRHWLKPGMTVIDVGANAGVYTFSAATRVGQEGKVIAIEPFPDCVRYLEETCRINQFDWVQVYGAAASDHPGNIRLFIHGASELNEVIADDAEVDPGQCVEVPCLTLDSLIETEQLHSLDFLKLDAEGHEIKVLQGAQKLIADFSPIILYENIAGSQGNNMEVAHFLIQQGYQLNVYRPYLQQFIALNSLDELDGQLNIVAMPKPL